jgi:hypothetical protein
METIFEHSRRGIFLSTERLTLEPGLRTVRLVMEAPPARERERDDAGGGKKW